jgi:hypothetical protein
MATQITVKANDQIVVPKGTEIVGLTKDDGTVMRYNGGKNRLDLVPPEWLEGLGSVITFGANKYRPNGWRDGMPWSDTMASALRHITSWQKGEELDSDSGLPHLLHAATNLMFLYTYGLENVGEDNRFIPTR